MDNRTGWLVAGGVACALVIGAAATALWYAVPAAEHRETQRGSYQKEITRLEMDLAGDDVTVIATDGEGVSLVRELHWRRTKPRFTETWSGTTLRIETDGCDHCDIDYVLRLPAGVVVDLHTDGGDVTTKDIAGQQQLVTSGGDVTLRNPSGDVNVRTEGGDVSVLGATGATVDAQTDGGDLEVSCDKAPTELRAVSAGGDVDVSVPDGTPYQVDASSAGGDERVEIDTYLDATHKVYVRSEGGDVDVRYA